MNSLPGIPEELRIKILSLLDAVALARCSMTCKSICETIKNSSSLAYTIQLHLNGLKDTRLSAPHADLLEHVLRHRQAWLSLEFGEPVTLELPYDGYGIRLVGAAFAYSDREHVAQIISLPTSSNIEKCSFQNARPGTLVLAFTMDPTQDMIALLYDDDTQPAQSDNRSLRIHTRTMSTDISHPLAHNSCLMMTLYPSVVYGNRPEQPSLYVAHNILAFTFFDPLIRWWRVMIWDWTTSHLILDSSLAVDPLLPPVRYGHQFGLIDHTYCSFTSPDDSGSIRLYKFIRPSGVTTPAIHLATLHLPPISTGISIMGISAQAGPVMAQATLHIPLVVNDADRLHVFTLTGFLCATSRAMRSRTDSGAGLPLDIPWMEWGPRNTRIIYPAYKTTARWYNRCVHGQRVVQAPRTTQPDPSVEVLDFSRAAVLAAQGILPRPPLSPMNPPGVLVPSSSIRHPYFRGDVETHLPFVSWTRELSKQYGNILVNEECIIGVQVDCAIPPQPKELEKPSGLYLATFSERMAIPTTLLSLPSSLRGAHTHIYASQPQL
ncbi:hypothetical protein BJ912DRAFT_1149427 [Pholiota molesta]|nr:hypothetical protein BJ912DRAFT_1149427 [Pholiota molesta]